MSMIKKRDGGIDVVKKNLLWYKNLKIKYMVVLVRKHLAFPNPVYIMFSYFLRHSIYYHTGIPCFKK